MHGPFGRGFYEWWVGLDTSYRYGIAVAILVVSAVLWYFDVGGWMLGGPMFFVGVVLLLFAGNAKS